MYKKFTIISYYYEKKYLDIFSLILYKILLLCQEIMKLSKYVYITLIVKVNRPL